MKVLVIGDIVGKPGRTIVKEYLEKKRNDYDFIIVNGENSAGGFGITEKIAREFFSLGVDLITSGNHIWDKKEIYEYLEREPKLLRPLNYPNVNVPGNGIYNGKTKKGEDISVVNLQGRIYMVPIDCPFARVEKALEEGEIKSKNLIVDFHAEATSEKIAMGWFLNGKASLVYGPHTHVQTADEKILDGGTAFFTDAGMTCSQHVVIGMTVESILPKFLNALPSRFELAKGNVRINGIEVEIEDGKATSINRLNISREEVEKLEYSTDDDFSDMFM